MVKSLKRPSLATTIPKTRLSHLAGDRGHRQPVQASPRQWIHPWKPIDFLIAWVMLRDVPWRTVNVITRWYVYGIYIIK